MYLGKTLNRFQCEITPKMASNHAISPNDGGLWGNMDQSTPLFRIRNKTMTLLGNLLDTEKILLSEEGYCRDWRGLKDFVSSKLQDTNNERFWLIQNQKNKTGAIIKIWSNPGFNTVIRDLLEALESIGRVDVAQQVAKSIKDDCAHAEKSSKPDDHKTITMYKDIVCDQDLAARRNKEELPIFDAMIMHGLSSSDEQFTQWMVNRLEDTFNLKIYWPLRDLMAGTMEREQNCKIIEERCKKVIAVFSPSFEHSDLNKWQMNSAITKSTSEPGFLLPVIYEKCQITGPVAGLTKLYYDPTSNISNFWVKLMKAFGKIGIPEEHCIMDFEGDPNKHTQNNGHNRSQIYDSENPINEILDLPSISSTALNSTTTIATDVSSISTTSTLILERQLPDTPNHEPTNMETIATGGKKKESRFPKMPAFLKKKRKSKDKSNPELS